MIRCVGLVLIVFLLAGCAATRRAVVVPQVNAVSAQELCRKYNIDCRWDGVSQTITMFYLDKKIQGLVGSDMVIVGKDRIALSAPLSRQRGVVMLPPDFERAVFGPAPVAQDDYVKGARLGALKKVIIDAGHGGKDPGAIGFGGLKEKDVVLDVALRLKKNFENAGAQVLMTRSSDNFISLRDRTVMSSSPDADIFVSIHANANAKRGASGIEVYYAGALSKEDQVEGQRLANERKICGLFNMHDDVPGIKEIVTGMLYAHKRSFSPGLSDAIARGLSSEMSRHSRGSKPERFFVLRNTLIPAVLVEIGFITNPRESSLLKDGAYRQRLADSIEKSILRFFYASGI